MEMCKILIARRKALGKASLGPGQDNYRDRPTATEGTKLNNNSGSGLMNTPPTKCCGK